jgi:hypothetical protein
MLCMGLTPFHSKDWFNRHAENLTFGFPNSGPTFRVDVLPAPESRHGHYLIDRRLRVQSV